MIEYFFICRCGTRSESLEQDYMRLRKEHSWTCKDCFDQETMEIVREFKGGYIVEKPDF